MKLIEIKKGTSPTTNCFNGNIEQETIENTDYRRVLFTSKLCQLVLMSLKPKEEIGEEVHKVDQFIRIDKGKGISIINGKEQKFEDGDAVIIPAGVKHNVINTGKEDLKLYTVYSPPQHKKDTIQKTKADEKEEHFDGETNI